MKAIGIRVVPSAHTVDTLEEMKVPKPTPTGRDILVKVLGAATNAVDYKALSMWSGTPGTQLDQSKIVGFDGAGVVEAVGSEAALFKPGDHVFFAGTLQRQGCFAEYVLIDERIVGRKPSNLTFTEAATVPLCWLTAYETLIYQLGVPQNNKKKETILIVNGAGGVGSLAIQIAKQVCNLEVIATASRPETIAFCKNLGADYTINHRNDLLDELKAIGKESSVKYIFDCYGLNSENWKVFVNILQPFGKVCSVLAVGNIDIFLAMMKSLTYTATSMFTRPMTGVDIEAQHEMLNLASSLIEKGAIKHTMQKEFEFNVEGLKEALSTHERSDAIGKNGIKFLVPDVEVKHNSEK